MILVWAIYICTENWTVPGQEGTWKVGSVRTNLEHVESSFIQVWVKNTRPTAPVQSSLAHGWGCWLPELTSRLLADQDGYSELQNESFLLSSPNNRISLEIP